MAGMTGYYVLFGFVALIALAINILMLVYGGSHKWGTSMNCKGSVCNQASNIPGNWLQTGRYEGAPEVTYSASKPEMESDPFVSRSPQSFQYPRKTGTNQKFQLATRNNVGWVCQDPNTARCTLQSTTAEEPMGDPATNLANLSNVYGEKEMMLALRGMQPVGPLYDEPDKLTRTESECMLGCSKPAQRWSCANLQGKTCMADDEGDYPDLYTCMAACGRRNPISSWSTRAPDQCARSIHGTSGEREGPCAIGPLGESGPQCPPKNVLSNLELSPLAEVPVITLGAPIGTPHGSEIPALPLRWNEKVGTLAMSKKIEQHAQGPAAIHDHFPSLSLQRQ